ncbi:Replicative DNA helicase (plasmid) [Streptomyces xanthophaeus]|uniref:replicative DNA helicase n=1 Tax=Streptomyces xanthophaeus TaxID=67385 RepID=UPI00233EB165|nr:replicative DNA helicase [Streptomyces xanthophaeus]WCD91149.1 Replicative DNA helicase [Streptomyces xanthophaeus]
MAEDGIEQAQPNDLQAERAVLHDMLISSDAIADIVEILHGHDFYRPAHAIIYTSILTIYAANQTPNPFSVCEHLTKMDQLDEAGGADYINDLARQKASGRSRAKNAETVLSTARLRRLQATALHIHDLAVDGTPEFIDRIADAAEAEIFAATAERPNSVPPAFSLGDIMEDALDEIEAVGERRGAPIGVPTGFTDLDSLTGGLRPGHLTVIAARPAMGKSTLALDILRSASIKNNLPTVLFTLESSRTEVAMRILSAEARVALHHMRSGTMTDDDWTRLARRMPDTSKAPLYVQDSAHATFTELRAQSRRLRSQRSIELIVVDDLQMFTYGTRPFSSRYEEISEIARCLKLLAKELEIPILAVSKLNRGPEQRADKKPQLSDLRDSGALEDNADLAILLHREDAYEKDSPRAGEADLIVAKHRNGPTATITVAFQGHYSRFVDMAST